MAGRALLAAVALAVIAGCAPVREPEPQVRTVEVEVPVPVMPRPPAELMARYRPEALPRWLPPDTGEASACLAPQGEERLRRIVDSLYARDTAWRAWVSEQRETGDERADD